MKKVFLVVFLQILLSACTDTGDQTVSWCKDMQAKIESKSEWSSFEVSEFDKKCK